MCIRDTVTRTSITAVYRTTADSVPSGARVRHYDELPPFLKESFPELVENVTRGPPAESDDNTGTFVKYTDYYYLLCE